MARTATGQVLERDGKRGRTYALRFRAYGRRQYVTLGSAEDGWTGRKAEFELENVLADVRRGIWRPPEPEPVVEPKAEPTFHEFASEWLMEREPELAPKTRQRYRWELSNHPSAFLRQLPSFGHHGRRGRPLQASEGSRPRTR